MIISSPPFQVNQELWGLLGCGPGATCQRSHPMTDREICPFNKSGVESSRQAQSQQGDLESLLCPKAHHVRDANQLTPPVVFSSPARRSTPLPPATHALSDPVLATWDIRSQNRRRAPGQSLSSLILSSRRVHAVVGGG